tara:strand:- start:2437 stop:3207 length:771 start_codon:yes stop_codon:yes gene_type:complete
MSLLSTDAEEALASTKLSGLRKRLNAESWSDNMENLLKQWGEKAGGLRFIHSSAGGGWKKFSNQLSIAGIVITSFASTISLVATSLDDEDAKTNVMYGVGAIGLVSTLIQSLKKFYNAEEKAADHIAVSKQFGSYYRYMTLQLGMSREDRESVDVLSSWALKEYERLQQESPGIGSDSIGVFKKKFNNEKQSFPDIAEDQYVINVYNSKKKIIHVPNENIVITSQTNDIEKSLPDECNFVDAKLPDENSEVEFQDK